MFSRNIPNPILIFMTFAVLSNSLIFVLCKSIVTEASAHAHDLVSLHKDCPGAPSSLPICPQDHLNALGGSIEKRGGASSKKNENGRDGNLAEHLHISFASETEYLRRDFEDIARILASLFRGDELHLGRFEAGFPYIIRKFEDTYLEKIIKFTSLPNNHETISLDGFIDAIFGDLHAVQQKYYRDIDRSAGESLPSKTSLDPEDNDRALIALDARVEALEIKLLQFLHHRKCEPSTLLQDKTSLALEMENLQTQFGEFQYHGTLQSEKLAFRINAVASFHGWISQIESEARPLLRADGVLADRMAEKLRAIEKVLKTLNPKQNIPTVKELGLQTERLLGDYKVYGFSSDVFLDEIVRSFHSVHQKLQFLGHKFEGNVTFEEIAIHAMLNNFQGAYMLLQTWAVGDLYAKVLCSKAQSLNSRVKSWVKDVQLWNLSPSPEVSYLHELAHKVVDGVLSARHCFSNEDRKQAF
ncbi:hypothetical protein JCM33374_g4961 [Metschnikowia sp. JCM 33374]|nr:hypothetical protein JCM33374_g4961 [Metschnikowia sp. JCM 33374]